MAEDWAINVRKYAPQADPDIIAGIIRHCGIALHSRDASLVSFNDPAETGRVRESFLKKKLGLMESDEKLDGSIASVGEKMRDENFRQRVTVYYLLADHYGKLEVFRKSPAQPGAGHANRTSTAEPSAPASLYAAPGTAPAHPHSAASSVTAAAYRAPGDMVDAAKANITDTAKSAAAGIDSFGAAGLAAGVAGLGAGGAGSRAFLMAVPLRAPAMRDQVLHRHLSAEAR